MHASLKLYTDVQLTGFSFVETFLPAAEIPYQMRKKPVQYIYMKLVEFLSKVKN